MTTRLRTCVELTFQICSKVAFLAVFCCPVAACQVARAEGPPEWMQEALQRVAAAGPNELVATWLLEGVTDVYPIRSSVETGVVAYVLTGCGRYAVPVEPAQQVAQTACEQPAHPYVYRLVRLGASEGLGVLVVDPRHKPTIGVRSGDGSLQWQREEGSAVRRVLVKNLDGDPADEIVLLTRSRLWIVDAATGEVQWSKGAGEVGFRDVAVGDVDRDGKLDVVVMDWEYVARTFVGANGLAAGEVPLRGRSVHEFAIAPYPKSNGSPHLFVVDENVEPPAVVILDPADGREVARIDDVYAHDLRVVWTRLRPSEPRALTLVYSGIELKGHGEIRSGQLSSDDALQDRAHFFTRSVVVRGGEKVRSREWPGRLVAAFVAPTGADDQTEAVYVGTNLGALWKFGPEGGAD